MLSSWQHVATKTRQTTQCSVARCRNFALSLGLYRCDSLLLCYGTSDIATTRRLVRFRLRQQAAGQHAVWCVFAYDNTPHDNTPAGAFSLTTTHRTTPRRLVRFRLRQHAAWCVFAYDNATHDNTPFGAFRLRQHAARQCRLVHFAYDAQN